MSKSLGNVILAKKFQQKYGGNVLRYLLLNSHYNQVINLSEELIQQAIDYIQKITNLLKKLNFYLYTEKITVAKKATNQSQEIITSLLNDLNTVKVLFFLEEIITSLNKDIDGKTNHKDFFEKITNFYFILNILGFKFDSPIYDLATKLLISEWQKARKEKNYLQADKIRKKLQEKTII